MRPWKLLEANFGYVTANPYEVAVLPLGATEPHNLHLPYGTDVMEADIVGDRICEAAHNQGAKVVLLPTIPYGTETNLRQFPLALNLNPSTLALVVRDLVESLAQSSIRKIVLLNSHGGNDLKPVLRELYGKTTAHVFLCNWYQTFRDVERELFHEPGDHAGELETSFGLAFFPDLVARHPDGTLAADAGAAATTPFEALNQGWVTMTRPWHLLTTNTGVGNPHAASADKGQRMMQIVVDRLSKFLVELAAAEVTDRFPFV
jgi:creatinine amidohydrolase